MTIPRQSPCPGDLLIATAQNGGHGYTLAVAPDGPSQLWYGSYDQALKVALKWATNSGVSVWRSNGGSEFDCLRSARPTAQDGSFDKLLARIRGEYAEMPGLWLTLEQAARLWALDSSGCDRLLRTLVEQGFLIVRADGKYGNPTDDRIEARPKLSQS